MELKPGYKQTQVGVIPEDWDALPLSVFADVKTGPFGSALHERDYVSDGTPIITVEHLSERGVVHENLPLVSDSDRSRLSNYSLRAGDIVFSRVGSVDRNALIRDSENGWLFSGRLLRVRVFHCDVHPPYLSFHFHSEPFKHRVRTVAVGQTMASLNTQILKGVYAVVPTEDEQRNIATALSDVDALLDGLNRLIAKKRDLKQAAMQQLLTGKTRLPGFEGEWMKTALGDLLTMNATYGIVTAGEFKSTGIPMMRGGDIKEGQISYDLPFVSPEKSSEYSRTVLKQSDIVIALVGYPGEAAKVPARLEGANISRAVGLLRLNKLIEPDYLVSYLNSPMGRRMVLAPSAGSAQLVVNLAALNKLELPLPSLPEQTAIATILSDMDTEITALEQRRTKTQAIKQAMMQELLTGKTRLI